MASPEHVSLLRRGASAWNAWWKERRHQLQEAIALRPRDFLQYVDPKDVLVANLSGIDIEERGFSEVGMHDIMLRAGADLSGADLESLDLCGVDLDTANLRRADLRGARLIGARLGDADLGWADLSGSDLSEASLGGWTDLGRANLSDAVLDRANLSDASLRKADLCAASLVAADLSSANLNGAALIRADLRDAILDGTELVGASLRGANLAGAKLHDARCGATDFGGIDLTVCSGLEAAYHVGASTIGVDTLASSKGRIPAAFLKGCGLTPWQIVAAELHDPGLGQGEIADLQNRISMERARGLAGVGGVFISYSTSDKRFVDTLHRSLEREGVPSWLDRRDMVAGDIQKQLAQAIRAHDIIVMVLSKAAIESDWVEHELNRARTKEKEERRDALCPIALDAAWKTKRGDVLWDQLFKKHVVDFSGWDADFEGPFRKLIQGLRRFYEQRDQGET